MQIGARNQLPGIITETTVGTVMAEVVVEVDASTIVAAITKASLDSLTLKKGDKVTVIVKATGVIIGK